MSTPNDTPKKTLNLFDSTCLITGIIIGTAIYMISPDIARGAGSWWGVLLLWIVGGAISMFGALAYAELGSAYPQEGGDYVYLTKAYGRWAGFLFGWIQTVIVRPADIVVMAFAFAMYIREVWNPLSNLPVVNMPWNDGQLDLGLAIYASSAVVVFTLINIIGVTPGKWTQNLLTVVKVAALLFIAAVAFYAPATDHPAQLLPDKFTPSLGLALIFVLFAFGGWNEVAYIAGEVRDHQRNIFRTLLVGLATVTCVYVLLNVAFMYALGYNGLANADAVGVDAVRGLFPDTGSRLVAAMICISALGAVNGLIFAGARITYALGSDHRLFRPLGKWNPTTGTPVRALLWQGGVAVLLIFLLGGFVEAILYTAAVVYSFYIATNLAVVVLRWRDPETPRPYRVTGYPLTTILFCVACVYCVYSAVIYKPQIALTGLGLMLLGLPVYWLSNLASKKL